MAEVLFDLLSTCLSTADDHYAVGRFGFSFKKLELRVSFKTLLTLFEPNANTYIPFCFCFFPYNVGSALTMLFSYFIDFSFYYPSCSFFLCLVMQASS